MELHSIIAVARFISYKRIVSTLALFIDVASSMRMVNISVTGGLLLSM